MSRRIVLIPAYNEEKSIGDVVTRTQSCVPEFDVVVINDGSTDGTGAILEQMGVDQIVHPFNLGYGASIETGLRYALRAGYDVVITLDGDGQHDPSEIRNLVECLDAQRADYVIGSRFVHERRYSGGMARRIGMWAFSILSSVVLGCRILDTTSGFRAMTAEACQALLNFHPLDFHAEAIVYLSLQGFNVCEVPVSIRERVGGHSMYSLRSSLAYPLKTLLLVGIAIISARLQGRRSQR